MSTHTTDPRCSFCGKTVEAGGTIVSGPDVHICGRCIQEARDMIEEGDPAEDDEIEIQKQDYDRAFEVYTRAQPPLQDVMKEQYGHRLVRVIALTIAWMRECEGRGRREAGPEALASCLRTGLPDYWEN